MENTPNNEVTVPIIEKQLPELLAITGEESFVNWEAFSKSTTEVLGIVESLNKQINIFRDTQHNYFLSNSKSIPLFNSVVKKLKGLDLPDVLRSVKNKKLPSQALKILAPRFKLIDGKAQIAEPIETLKNEAVTTFQNWIKHNEQVVEQFKKLEEFLKEKNNSSEFKVDIPEEMKPSAKYSFPSDKIQELSAPIELQFISGSNLIGLKTYSQIVDASVELVSDEYAKVTAESRKKQRESMKEPAKYLLAMNEYMVNCETLIGEGQIAIAEKLGVNHKKLEESEVTLMERGLGSNVFGVQSVARNKLKEKLKPSKPVSAEESQAVLQFQVDMIRQKSDYIGDILSGLTRTPETTQMIPILLTIILNDLVFEKFQLEEEDFMQNLSEASITSNPSLVVLFREMEVAIIELMQKLGLIPADIGKYMQENMNAQGANVAASNPQGLPPGMMPGVMPGMMPGMDPMAMLAFQQMQAQKNMKQ